MAHHSHRSDLRLYSLRTGFKGQYGAGLYVLWVLFCQLWRLLDCYQMSFTIYQANGLKVIQYFFNMDELIKSMLNNPKDCYHRNV
jgi:hypothetical protein